MLVVTTHWSAGVLMVPKTLTMTAAVVSASGGPSMRGDTASCGPARVVIVSGRCMWWGVCRCQASVTGFASAGEQQKQRSRIVNALCTVHLVDSSATSKDKAIDSQREREPMRIRVGNKRES